MMDKQSKAWRLLEPFLTSEQKRTLSGLNPYIDIVGSSKATWRYYPKRPIFPLWKLHYKKEKDEHRYCFSPLRRVPQEDIILSLKLMLEWDDGVVYAVANRLLEPGRTKNATSRGYYASTAGRIASARSARQRTKG